MAHDQRSAVASAPAARAIKGSTPAAAPALKPASAPAPAEDDDGITFF